MAEAKIKKAEKAEKTEKEAAKLSKHEEIKTKSDQYMKTTFPGFRCKFLFIKEDSPRYRINKYENHEIVDSKFIRVFTNKDGMHHVEA